MPVHPRECIGPMFIYNAWPILEGQCRADGHNFIEPMFAADVGPMDRPTSSQRWVKSGPIFYASWVYVFNCCIIRSQTLNNGITIITPQTNLNLVSLL